MKKFLSFLISPICIILLLATAVRVNYFLHDARPNIMPDSYGYYSRAVKLTAGNPLLILFSDERVPVYPLIIAAAAHPKELLIQSVYTQSFPNDRLLLLINTLTGIGTIMLTVMILTAMRAPTPLVYFIGILVATNGALLYWEHAILPETLATFGLTAFVYTSIHYLQKHKRTSLYILWGLAVILFLLKPVFVALPVLLFTYFFFTHLPKKQHILVAVALILYGAVLIGYIQGNKYFHGYGGINHAGDINMLGRIMQFHLPPSTSSHSFFSSKLAEYERLGKEVMPYRFLEWSDPAIYGTGWLLEDLRIFTKETINQNVPQYIASAAPDIIPSLITYDVPNDSYLTNDPFLSRILMPIAIGARYACLLFLFLFPMYGIIWFLHAAKNNKLQIRYAQILCIGGSAFYFVCMAAFGSYDNFGRLTAPALPLTLIFVGIGITDGIRYFQKKRHK